MFFKRKQIIASLILSLFFNFNIFNNFNDNYKITFIGDEIKKAYEETPDVIVNGIKLDDDYIGYAYADLAIYSLPFTETSRIYVVKVDYSITSGYVANKSGEKFNGADYDVNYDLLNGTLYTSIKRAGSGEMKSSSYNFIDVFPKSSSMNATYTSSYGTQTSTNFGTKLSLDGLMISVSGARQISYSCSKTLSVSEPVVSSQASSTDYQKKTLYYEYNSSLHLPSLNLTHYILLEVKNDGNTYMYNQYSFYIELGCDVTNVAYKGWIWQQNKKLIGSYKYHYGC